jgi:hypothetical protein
MPVKDMRLVHFRTVACWVRILHIDEKDYLPECLPVEFLNRIEDIFNDGRLFVNLRSVVLRHEHHVTPCLQSYHFARFLIQNSLESLDLSTKHEYGGFLISPSHIESLCTAIRRKKVLLKHLAIRCVHPVDIGNTWSRVLSAAIAIGSISTLTRLSINGCLLCDSALLEIGSLHRLAGFEIEGGIPSGMSMRMPETGYFPALKCLVLRFLPSEDSKILCSCSALLHSLQILAVEWDSQTEFGDPDIDGTLREIGRHCPSLTELRVGLFEKFHPRKAHGLSYSIWCSLASRNLHILALLGLFLKVNGMKRLLPDIGETWPNLVSLIVPAQVLSSEQERSLSSRTSSSPMIVHSGDVSCMDNSMFVIWWVAQCFTVPCCELTGTCQ